MNSSLTINGKEIPTELKYINQSDLLFYKENPRIYSLVYSGDDILSQGDIEDKLCSMDHVKQLSQSIEANGGLIDPLIVQEKKKIVLEGNSRLAAYRLLCRKDAIKWGKVKCTLLPENIGEDEIFALLGEYHIIGRKDWVPYEQAGYLWRRHDKHKISAEKMAKEMGISSIRVNQLISIYSFMYEHKEINPQRWSYYDEYFKSKNIKKARDYIPEFDKVIVSKIKKGEIEKAIDVRDKVALIAGKKGKILNKFVNNENTIEQCYDQAIAGGANNAIYKKLSSFRSAISDPDVKKTLKNMNNDHKKKCKYELGKLKIRILELYKIL